MTDSTVIKLSRHTVVVDICLLNQPSVVCYYVITKSEHPSLITTPLFALNTSYTCSPTHVVSNTCILHLWS
jgi:hypothetical protein